MPKAKPPVKGKPAKKSMETKPTAKGFSTRRVPGDCVIPPRAPDAVLQHFKGEGSKEEAQYIREYVESQCRKDNERVIFLEKVKTEYVLGQAHDCWNVHTDKEPHWVITGPTNLYTQALFPSLDYTISFHLGLMLRLNSKRKGTEDSRMGDRLAAAFRRWEQAAVSLDESVESENIQAVGMRCREALLAFIRSVSNTNMVPAGEVKPQTANFVEWSKLVS